MKRFSNSAGNMKKKVVKKLDLESMSLLCKAIRKDKLEIFKVLLKDEDLYKTNSEGEYWIHQATKCGSLNILKYLIEERSFNVNLRKHGYEHSLRTCLHHAAKLGFKDIVIYLLKQNGIKVSLKDAYGLTAERISKTNEIIRIIRNFSPNDKECKDERMESEIDDNTVTEEVAGDKMKILNDKIKNLISIYKESRMENEQLEQRIEELESSFLIANIKKKYPNLRAINLDELLKIKRILIRKERSIKGFRSVIDDLINESNEKCKNNLRKMFIQS